jgi:hypothetical protein
MHLRNVSCARNVALSLLLCSSLFSPAVKTTFAAQPGKCRLTQSNAQHSL